jgi:hypothetical protein
MCGGGFAPAVSYKHAIGLGPWFGLRPT